MRCEHCGHAQGSVPPEEAERRLKAFYASIPEIHRKAYRRIFRAIHLLEGTTDQSAEFRFLNRMAYEGVASQQALIVLSGFLEDGIYWTRLRESISHRWPYLTESVVATVNRTRGRNRRPAQRRA